MSISASLVLASSTQASQITWANSGTTWATGGDWVGGVAPVDGTITDTALFNSSSYTFQPTVTVPRSIAGITANGSGNLTITETGALTIGSSGITVGAGAGSVTLSGATVLAGSQVWTNNSSSLITVGAITSGSTSSTLTIGGSGSGGFAFTDVISNNGTALTGVTVSAPNSKTTMSASNTYTNGTTVTNSQLATTLAASGTPFGVGAMTLTNSTLTLAPSGTGSAIAYTGASTFAINGTSLTAGQSILAFNKGNETSVTYTVGNGSTGSNVILRNGSRATLIIEPSAVGNLGVSEIFNINATGSQNLETVTNGMISPYVVGLGVTTANMGDFLTYGGAGFTGFNSAASSYVNTGNATNPTFSGTKILNVNGNVSFTSSPSVIQSLLVQSGDTLSISSGKTVSISSSGGGLIMNGGTISGGTLAFNSAEALVYAFNGTSSISSVIGGSSGLTLSGNGTLISSGANTITGKTTVDSGTLEFSAPSSLYSATTGSWTPANITVNTGATLAVGVDTSGSAGFSSTNLDSLLGSSGLGASTATTGLLSGSTLGLDTTNAAGGSFTYGTAIANPNSGANALGVTKLGAGTLILSGNNSYTSATTVNGGTLELDGTDSSATGTVTIGGSAAGNSPKLTGVGTLGGAVIVSSAGGGAAGTISPGVGSALGTLTVGSISFQTGSTFAVNLNSTSSSKLAATGALSNAGTDNITFAGTTGATTTSGVGNYVLATAGSGISAAAFTGTAPTDYRLLDNGLGTQLNLTHEATIGTLTATPANATIITGGTTAFGVTVYNSAPSGSSSLNPSGASGTNTTGSFTTGTISAAAQSTSSSAAGLTFTGTTVGAAVTGTFTLADANADNSPQTGTVTVDVLGHSNGVLGVASGNNQTVIVGATGVTAGLTLTNAGTNLASLLVNSVGSGLTGSTTTVANGGSNAYTAALNTSTVGASQSEGYTINVQDAALPGQGSAYNATANVTLNVRGHAAPTTVTGGALTLGTIHAGYASAKASTNTDSVTNGTGSQYIVALLGSGAQTGGSTSGLTLNSIGGSQTITAGTGANIGASLATGLSAGIINQNFTYTFGDDSSLSGASANVNQQTINVTGQVYSGKMIWNGTSGDTWNTATDWNDSQASGVHAAPGLDSGFTGVDTATFGNISGSNTVNLGSSSPNLNAITFNGTGSYTIAQGAGGTGSVILSGTSPAITVSSGTDAISAPVSLQSSTTAVTVTNSTDQLTLSGAISGTGTNAITLSGAGTTILSNATGNGYTGGTTVGAGKLYVNNTSNSGTGTGAVLVTGGTLAGTGSISGKVSLTGGSLYSGGVATGQPNVSANTVPNPPATTVKAGLTLTNTSTSVTSPALSISSANLTFALGADTTSSGTAYGFAHPSYNSTYMSASGEIVFSGSDTISLVDLTNTTGSNGMLTLRQSVPYLLISDSLGDAGYYGLVTMTGGGASAVYSLDGNGFVVGDLNAAGLAAYGTNANGSVLSGFSLSDVNAINIAQFGAYGANGMTALSPGTGGIYPAPALYLYNGDLEVVPEPGTWALMLGGLALLIVIQRRRNKMD